MAFILWMTIVLVFVVTKDWLVAQSYILQQTSVSDNVSNDLTPLPINDESTFIYQDLFTSHTSDDINCPMSQEMISTADLSCSNIQEEMVEPLFDEAFVSNSTFVEVTNIPITDEAAVVRE